MFRKDNKGKQKKNNKKKQQLIEKQQHELLEVAKQFGEAMGERLHFRYFYVLLESVEFIREYDSKQCQMVPSTYYRAFQVSTSLPSFSLLLVIINQECSRRVFVFTSI